jgi:predicted RNA-binding Zn ribbon-like protein
MLVDNPRVQTLRLLGGELCLDFVNTVEDRAGQHRDDRITSFADLIAWGAHAGIVQEQEATEMLSISRDDPIRARSVFGNAIELREALHNVFLHIARRYDPPVDDRERIGLAYRDAIGHANLVRHEHRYRWQWDVSNPESIHRIVASSAVDLLTNGDLRRVKVCANPGGCGWLFFDRSKNASRRWCSMEGCGTRDKMRRYLSKRNSARRR